MPKELPPPLPPKERTVGQVVAESIRLYGHRFWPCLVLGLPIAAITQVSAGQSLTAQMIVLWVATPFLTAAYVRAIVLASPEPLERDALVRAFVVGVVVFLPVPVLVRLYVLPALAWLALFGLAVPAAAHERLGFRDALAARPPSRRRGLRPRARLAVRARDRLLRDAGDARRPPARSGGRGGADRRVHRRPRHLAASLHRACAALLRPGRPRRRLGPPREEEARCRSTSCCRRSPFKASRP